MKVLRASAMVLLLGMSVLLPSAAALAQDEDDFDQSYDEYGADVDEIMETDDALTYEARTAQAAREAGLDMETVKMLEGVKWLGHASFLIEDEEIIYIDPYNVPDGLPAADIILITHEHRDHLSPADIVKLLKPSTKVITVEAARSLVPSEVDSVIAVTPGQGIRVDGIKIDVVPAYNKDKDFHPKKRGDAGYVIHLTGRTIYHAGDTDFIDEMKDIDADIALLPAGGTYTMDAEEAARAADAIKPKVAIPMHWGTIVGSEKDAEAFVANCEVPAIVLDVYTPPADSDTERE
jgi:L-ascorbate metabolism protein UlaG (beta-lactamase superfamily)